MRSKKYPVRRMRCLAAAAFAAGTLASAGAQPKEVPLDRLNLQVMKAMAAHKYGEAITIMDQSVLGVKAGGSGCDYPGLVAAKDVPALKQLLGNFAYCLYKDYERAVLKECRQRADTSRGLDTALPPLVKALQARDLRRAAAVLKGVLVLDSTRIECYLNIADILYNMDKEKEAQENYALFIAKMKARGKEKAIPAWVLDPGKRKKMVNCK